MIYCLGSINTDYTYRVDHFPMPGETLAAAELLQGLGGKGANQSVAAAQAGAQVIHIGAVGPDGASSLNALRGYSVDTAHIIQVEEPTGHAIITLGPKQENTIVIYAGANQKQSLTHLKTTISSMTSNDILLLQNETNLGIEAAQIAQTNGATVIYSAAPFSQLAVDAIMPFVDILVMNKGEAAQLRVQPTCHQIVTQGADGAEWIDGAEINHIPAHPTDVQDTSGAGDCFIGYVAAGLDQGMSPTAAMRLAAAAAALQVSRPGTAQAIPSRAEVDALLSSGTSL